MKDITFTLIEIFVSLIVETVILGGVFSWVSNKTSSKMEFALNDEIKKVEEQNKMIYSQLQNEIRIAKREMISQIKESEPKK
jgi:biopolymer transport protein ExbB/TolQ